MNIVVSADFLKSLEKLCWSLGISRQQFDHQIFAAGVDALTTYAQQANDEEFQAEMNMLGGLGKMARKDRQEF
jgi:hypothetical protein